MASRGPGEIAAELEALRQEVLRSIYDDNSNDNDAHLVANRVPSNEEIEREIRDRAPTDMHNVRHPTLLLDIENNNISSTSPSTGIDAHTALMMRLMRENAELQSQVIGSATRAVSDDDNTPNDDVFSKPPAVDENGYDGIIYTTYVPLSQLAASTVPIEEADRIVQELAARHQLSNFGVNTDQDCCHFLQREVFAMEAIAMEPDIQKAKDEEKKQNEKMKKEQRRLREQMAKEKKAKEKQKRKAKERAVSRSRSTTTNNVAGRGVDEHHLVSPSTPSSTFASVVSVSNHPAVQRGVSRGDATTTSSPSTSSSSSSSSDSNDNDSDSSASSEDDVQNSIRTTTTAGTTSSPSPSSTQRSSVVVSVSPTSRVRPTITTTATATGPIQPMSVTTPTPSLKQRRPSLFHRMFGCCSASAAADVSSNIKALFTMEQIERMFCFVCDVVEGLVFEKKLQVPGEVHTTDILNTRPDDVVGELVRLNDLLSVSNSSSKKRSDDVTPPSRNKAMSLFGITVWPRLVIALLRMMPSPLLTLTQMQQLGILATPSNNNDNVILSIDSSYPKVLRRVVDHLTYLSSLHLSMFGTDRVKLCADVFAGAVVSSSSSLLPDASAQVNVSERLAQILFESAQQKARDDLDSDDSLV
eukprot:PhM_4_TR434/c0_g1_i1/m.337